MTFAAAGAALAVLGSARIFAGAHQAFLSAKDLEKFAQKEAAIDIANAEAAANVALMNAFRAEFDAERVRDARDLALIDVTRAGRRQQGRVRVAAAKAGLQETGTIVDILEQQAYETGRAAVAVHVSANLAEERSLLEARDLRLAADAARRQGQDVAKRRLNEAAARARTIRTRAFTNISQGFLALSSAGTSAFGGAGMGAPSGGGSIGQGGGME